MRLTNAMKALIFAPARAVDAPPVQVQLHQCVKRVRTNDAKSVDEERCKLGIFFCSQYEDVRIYLDLSSAEIFK
jgi:hypothetical protein